MNIALYQRLVNKRNTKKSELRCALDTNNAEAVQRIVTEIQEIDDLIEDLEVELEEEYEIIA